MRVVHADPRRGLQPGPKHRLILSDQAVHTFAEQPHHLALENRHAHADQQRRQPLAARLALEVSRREEPPQLRPIAAQDTRRQRRHGPLATGASPTLAAVAHPSQPRSADPAPNVFVAQKDPNGGEAITTTSAVISRLSRLPPRRRLERPLPCEEADVAFSIPDGLPLNCGRGGSPFSHAISSFSSRFSALKSVTSSISAITSRRHAGKSRPARESAPSANLNNRVGK